MPDLLKNFLQNQYCNSCGERLKDANVEILAESENHVLAQIDCPHCGAEHIATISEQKRKENNMDNKKNTPLANSTPITSNDVLDVHKFLQNFDGNYSSLFGTETKKKKTGKKKKNIQKKDNRYLFRT